jgi:hypothetical protein
VFGHALLAFLVLPGLAAVIAPPFIALVDPWRGQTWLPGLAIMCGGAFVLLWCVRDFYVSGKGTLAPWDPPKQLVVVGLYRVTLFESYKLGQRNNSGRYRGPVLSEKTVVWKKA